MRFNSPQYALRWAYETQSRPIIRTMALAATRNVSNGSSGELGYDRHARAALIISLCERVLPILHMSYVRIQFGREAGGFDVLAHHIAANFGTGIHSRTGIELIIRAYCGKKIGLREIRKSMSCGMFKAVSYRNQAYDALDIIHGQAMDRLRIVMESRGFLRSVQVAGQS